MMKKALFAVGVLASALFFGCAGTSRLTEGMSREEVRRIMGVPGGVFHGVSSGDRLEMWVYHQRILPGIPNFMTDYDYIIPPLQGRDSKLLFVNGRLRLGGKERAGMAKAPPPARGAAKKGGQPGQAAREAEEEVFNFNGIRFGMTRDEVQKTLATFSPARLHKSTGGDYGDYLVDNPAGKILNLYFKFDDKGRLYWMRAQYPYSLTEPARNRPLLEMMRAQYEQPILRTHKDVGITIDDKRMRMTLVSVPLMEEYRRRVPDSAQR